MPAGLVSGTLAQPLHGDLVTSCLPSLTEEKSRAEYRVEHSLTSTIASEDVVCVFN